MTKNNKFKLLILNLISINKLDCLNFDIIIIFNKYKNLPLYFVQTKNIFTNCALKILKVSTI